MRPVVLPTILFGAELLVAAGVTLLDRPPGSLAASAPVAAFSGERAMTHVAAVAQKPHPVGSEDHDRVRDYLVAQIAGRGLTPEVQGAIGVSTRFQAAGHVQNVLVRLPGSSGGSDAVLLLAHYDSVTTAPGASDDGAGIAVLLETLRALCAGPPLRHDVIFLFSDGEEDALLGAAAFAKQHPWARDVRLALNFDTRGETGQAGAYETSSENGFLIGTLASAYPHVQTSSLYYEIYKRLPNESDLSIFKRSGVAAMNLGFARHFEFYHTGFDRPERLDHGSVQQLGGAALALTRRFADGDLRALRATDAVFLSLPLIGLVHYPYTWTWPLVGIAAVVWIAGAIRLIRRGGSRIGAVLSAAVMQLLAAVLLAACGFGIAAGLDALHGSVLPAGPVYTSAPYMLAMVGVLLILWLSLWSLLRRWFSAKSLTLASGLVLLALSVLSTALMTGASFLVAWPALALASSPFVLAGGERAASPKRMAALVLLSIPALVILVGAFHGLFDALGLAPEGGGVLGLLLAVLFVASAEVIEEIRRPAAVRPMLLVAPAALVSFVVGAVGTRHSAAHPEPSLMLYALDADAGQARWATSSEHPNEWASQFFGRGSVHERLREFAYSQFTSRELLCASAPRVPLAPASADVVGDERAKGTRTVTVLVRPPAGARAVILLAPKDLVSGATIGGTALDDPRDRYAEFEKWRLFLYNAPAAGAEIRFELKRDAPLPLTTLAYYSGLPTSAGASFRPRPPELMEHDGGDRSLVKKQFEL